MKGESKLTARELERKINGLIAEYMEDGFDYNQVVALVNPRVAGKLHFWGHDRSGKYDAVYPYWDDGYYWGVPVRFSDEINDVDVVLDD